MNSQQTPPDPTRDGNLCSHPFRVMYNETQARQDGSIVVHAVYHCGMSSFEEAKHTVLHFRDLASKGQHFLSQYNGYPVLNSAWLEYEHRSELGV